MNLERIRLVALDVDGTLTDGRLLYGPEGVSQTFSAKDGQGIMKLLHAGIAVAFVSFRDFPSTRRRAADLGVSLLCLGSSDKALALENLAEHLGIPASSILFMGDDEKDIPAMRTAGVSACPSDASAAAKAICHITTGAAGGAGAVREIAEAVLEARNE